MKRLIQSVLIGVVVSCVMIGAAEAGDRGRHKSHRHAAPHRVVYQPHYFEPRHIHVIGEYYRPYYRPVPRPARYVYARSGYLPAGWATRVVPVPVRIARQLPPVPYGYHRGVIDGHAVVYSPTGFIFDVAVLF